MALSPNEKDTLYRRAISLSLRDMVRTGAHSPDLTTNDPENKTEQSGGSTVDNSRGECMTIYSISESPRTRM